MSILLLLAGFCFLCLCGAVGNLIVAQKILNRAFDMVNFTVALHEQQLNESAIDKPEVSD